MPVPNVEHIRNGLQGRVVIPASLRRELGLKAGQVLVARVDGDRLILEPREAVLRRLQAQFAEHVPPGVSLVDELIAERCEEARREAAEM